MKRLLFIVALATIAYLAVPSFAGRDTGMPMKEELLEFSVDPTTGPFVWLNGAGEFCTSVPHPTSGGVMVTYYNGVIPWITVHFAAMPIGGLFGFDVDQDGEIERPVLNLTGN